MTTCKHRWPKSSDWQDIGWGVFAKTGSCENKCGAVRTETKATYEMMGYGERCWSYSWQVYMP